MTTLREAAQQALEALEYRDGDGADQWKADVITALRAALAQQEEPVTGIIESEIKEDSHQTLDDAMQQPRAMAQAYENGYKAGVAARDAEHQQTLALQQRSYEREIQLDVEAERERCLRLIDEHVRAVDAEDLVRAIKEGKE